MVVSILPGAVVVRDQDTVTMSLLGWDLLGMQAHCSASNAATPDRYPWLWIDRPGVGGLWINHSMVGGR